MAGGLATTFSLLANTDNDAAAGVLLTALDASQREIRDQALAALLCRKSDAAQRRILDRWQDLPARWKSQIAQRPGWLSAAIRRAVSGDDRRRCASACEAALFTRDYDLIPALVAAATDRANPHAELASAAVLELAELLADELTKERDYRVRRDPHVLRDSVLPSLERAAGDLDLHGRGELLEAFLLLAGRENALLKRLLRARAERSFLPLVELLTTSSRPAVERLLLSYLDDPHAPLAAVQVVGRRGDVAFLRHAARKIGPAPSPTVRHNLRRIETIPWITAKLSVLDALSEAEQPGAVQLAVCSSAPRHHALEVVAYVLRHGTLAARRVAAAALAGFRGTPANELAAQTLDDDDPHVRAAVARQLRDRQVPGAVARLCDLLDSPHEPEREAARDSLAEFKYESFAANFDNLPPQARSTAGRLVRRIDPNALALVRADLLDAGRGRRRRALEMIAALGAAAELHDSLVELLADEDPFLRIEAIRTLSSHDTPLTRHAIRDALLDSHPLVQQAADAALAQLTRRDTVPLAADSRDTIRLAAEDSPPSPSLALAEVPP